MIIYALQYFFAENFMRNLLIPFFYRSLLENNMDYGSGRNQVKDA